MLDTGYYIASPCWTYRSQMATRFRGHPGIAGTPRAAITVRPDALGPFACRGGARPRQLPGVRPGAPESPHDPGSASDPGPAAGSWSAPGQIPGQRAADDLRGDQKGQPGQSPRAALS